jgi:hypothetical protein
MNSNNILDIFNIIIRISPWSIVKIFILILLALYIIFAAVLNRQVTLMNQVLEAKFSPIIKLLAIIHLFVTLGLFLIALLFL